jgi:hypothetical protein
LSTAYLLTEEEVDESSFPLDYISLRILIYWLRIVEVSIFIFIFILLISEGQAGDIW